MSKAYDYLIVGAGLFGAVFAHEATKAGRKCLVVDKRDHIAGNIYTEQVEGINRPPLRRAYLPHQQQAGVGTMSTSSRCSTATRTSPGGQTTTASCTTCPST